VRTRAVRGDRGFTVVELSISMAISGVLMVAMLGILVSQSNAERRVSSFADNLEELRQTSVALQRDLRSSEPLVDLPTAPEFAKRIDLLVYRNINASTAVSLRWRVFVAGTGERQLIREELDASGNPTAVTYRLRGLADGAVFSFYKADGVAFDVSPASTEQPHDIADCTVRVRFALRAAPNRGPAPAQLTSDAQLRNRLPGGVGCQDALAP
jgi:prepilin-type N-terminal cleavage/methylation domain-containing protein